jgi:perosamine synthetase
MMEKLAVFGGTPIRDKFLPYGRQTIEQDDIEAVVEVLKSDYLTTGPKVAEFEKEFASYTGARFAVAVSNGTAALHAAAFAAGFQPGDEVITTPITFAASANCVLYMGAKPVFADILPGTCNIDPDEVRKKITNNTKGIIPVDFTGQPVMYDEINKIAQEYGLCVIEDAAHSLGADYKGKKTGTITDMATFSFHPVKHITTGEGGMITTDDEELYRKLVLFRTHGITRDSNQLEQNHGKWYYEQLELGFNYRITDFQCALGMSQLKKIDRFVSRRRQLADYYNQAFKGLEGIMLQKEEEGCISSRHLYIIRLNLKRLKASRKEVFDALLAENIGVNVHYLPVYLHPYYRKLGYEKGLCPTAEDLYESMITLPLFPSMTDNDARDVVCAVKKVLAHYH